MAALEALPGRQYESFPVSRPPPSRHTQYGDARYFTQRLPTFAHCM